MMLVDDFPSLVKPSVPRWRSFVSLLPAKIRIFRPASGGENEPRILSDIPKFPIAAKNYEAQDNMLFLPVLPNMRHDLGHNKFIEVFFHYVP